MSRSLISERHKSQANRGAIDQRGTVHATKLDEVQQMTSSNRLCVEGTDSLSVPLHQNWRIAIVRNYLQWTIQFGHML